MFVLPDLISVGITLYDIFTKIYEYNKNKRNSLRLEQYSELFLKTFITSIKQYKSNKNSEFDQIQFEYDKTKIKESFSRKIKVKIKNSGINILTEKLFIDGYSDFLYEENLITVNSTSKNNKNEFSQEDIIQHIHNVIENTMLVFHCEVFSRDPLTFIKIDIDKLFNLIVTLKNEIFNENQTLQKTIEEVKNTVSPTIDNYLEFFEHFEDDLQYYVNRKEIEEKIDEVLNDKDVEIIFVHGQSGSGKSTLLANLVKKYDFPPNYFFSKSTENRMDEVKNKLSEMKKNNFRLNIDNYEDFSNEYEKNQKNADNRVVIIDGLDESGEIPADLFSKNNYKYIVSARTNSVPHQKLNDYLNNKYKIQYIEIETESDRKSIENTEEYLIKRIKDDEKLNNKNIKKKLKNEIVEKGKGNFAFVAFCLNVLSNNEELPEKLPDNYNGLYEKVIDKLVNKLEITDKKYFYDIVCFYSMIKIPFDINELNNIYNLKGFEKKNFDDLWGRIKWLFKEFKNPDGNKYILSHSSLKEYFYSNNMDNMIKQTYEDIFEYYIKTENNYDEIKKYLDEYMAEHLYDYSLIPQVDLKILDNSIDKYLGETEEKNPKNYLEFEKSRILSALCYINMMLNKYRDSQKYMDLKIKILNILEKSIDISAIDIIKKLISKSDYFNALKIVLIDKNFLIANELKLFWGQRIIIKENFQLPSKTMDYNYYYIFVIEKLIEKYLRQNESLSIEIENIINSLSNDHEKAILYMAISKTCLKNNNLNKVRKWLLKAEDSIMKINSPDKKNNNLLEIIKYYVELGRKDKVEHLEKAKKIISNMDDSWYKNEGTFEIANAYIKINEKGQAELLLEELKESILNEIDSIKNLGKKTISNFDSSEKRNKEIIRLAKIYVAINKSDKAISFLKQAGKKVLEITDSGRKNKKIFEIANAYIEINKKGETDEIELLLEEVKKSILKEIDSIKDLGEKIIQNFDFSEKRNKEIIKLVKNYVAINKKDKAISFLKQVDKKTSGMIDSNEKNKKILEVADAYIEINEKDQAELILEKLKKDILKEFDSIKDLVEKTIHNFDFSEERNKEIIDFVKNCLGINKRSEIIFSVENILKYNNLGGRCETIVEIAKIYNKIDEKSKAISSLKKAKEITLKINNISDKIFILHNIINCYIDMNEESKAMTLLRETEEIAIEINHPILGYIEIIRTIENYIKINKSDKIISLLKKAGEFALKIDNSCYRNYSILEIIKGYIAINKKEIAIPFFKKVEEHVLKINHSRERNETIPVIVKGYIKLNENDKAISFLEKAEEIILEIDNLEKKSYAILEISKSFIVLKKKEKVISLIEQIEEVTLKINDPWAKCKIILELARNYNEINEKRKAVLFLKEAEELITIMNDDSNRRDIGLLEIINIYTELANNKKIEYLQRAYTLVSKLSILYKYNALLEIAKTYININKNDEAFLFLEKAKKIVLKTNKIYQRLTIAKCYIDINEKKEALLFLEKPEKIISKITDPFQKNIEVIEITKNYLDLNEEKLAVSFLEKIISETNDLFLNNIGLTKIIKTHIELHQKKEVVILLERIKKIILKITNSLLENIEIIKVTKNYLDLNVLFKVQKSLNNNNINKSNSISKVTDQILSHSNTIKLDRSLDEKFQLLEYILFFCSDEKNTIKKILVSIKNDLVLLPLYETTNYILLLSKIVSE